MDMTLSVRPHKTLHELGFDIFDIYVRIVISGRFSFGLCDQKLNSDLKTK